MVRRALEFREIVEVLAQRRAHRACHRRIHRLGVVPHGLVSLHVRRTANGSAEITNAGV